MRDKKDNATFDLPGFGSAAPLEPEPKRAPPPRVRRASLKQEQMELLDPTDASGLPIWQNDPELDLSGLPIWRK
jgi:hypothetical protein